MMCILSVIWLETSTMRFWISITSGHYFFCSYKCYYLDQQVTCKYIDH